MTVHKAQGSEWDTVIVALAGNPYERKSLAYNECTRARRNLVVVEVEGALKAAVGRNQRRRSVLEAVWSNNNSRLERLGLSQTLG